MAWWSPERTPGLIAWGPDRWWVPGAPTSLAEFYDQYGWERDPAIVSYYFGGVLETVTASRTAIYTIEAIDADGVLLDEITDWFKGRLSFQLDEASTLEFTVPGTSDNVAYLVPENRIQVRDRFGFLLECFEIQSGTKRRKGDAIYFDAKLHSAIVQLGKEPVLEFTTGVDADFVPETMTVAAIVTALLDLQVQSPPISLGRIDDAIGNYEIAFTVTGGGTTSILQAIKDIQAILPIELAGHFFVDGKRRLRWQLAVGSHRGETIEVGAGLQGIEYSIRYDDMITRLYLYGEGDDPATRVKLTDEGADEAEEYIESDTVGTWGVKPLVKVDKRIKWPQTLLEVAQRVIEEFKNPAIEIRLNALDVAKADGTRFAGKYDLYVGSVYTATDSAQDISEAVTVQSLTLDMQNVLPVNMELNNRQRDLASLLESIIRSLNAPLDVDGTRYPSMGRNYSDRTNPQYRAGDTRYNGNPQMHNGTDWEDMNAASGNAVIWKVANYAAFAALTEDVDGDLGFTIDLQNFYINKGGTYRIAGVFKQAAAPSSIGEQNGDLWYDSTNHNLMAYTNSVWRITHAHIANSTPAGTVNDGDRWYEEDADVSWIRRAGVWVSQYATHVSGSSPSSGVVDGDLWYDSTLHQIMARRNGAWRALHAHIAAAAPSTNVANGDYWYDSTNNRMYYRKSGAWIILPHTTSNKLYYYNGTSDLVVSHFS